MTKLFVVAAPLLATTTNNTRQINVNLPRIESCITSANEKKSFISLLNERLSIKPNNSEYRQNNNEWLDIYEQPKQWSLFLYISTIILGFLFISITWTWTLRSRVRQHVNTIRQSEELFTTIFKESPSIIVISDFETSRLIEVNDAFEKASGFKASEVIGKPITSTGLLFRPEDHQHMRALIKSEEGLKEMEMFFKNKNGEIVSCLVSASKILYKNRPSAILVITDITKLKKMEDELVRAKEKAEESDRLKSAFLANMSHEIRTPMNVIVGFSELFLEPNLTFEEKNEFVQHIKTNSYLLLDIINDIINISKVESGSMPITISEIKPEEIIKELETYYLPDAQDKNLRLSCEFPILGINKFFSDKAKLMQVLSNLISNAIKFTDKGTISFGYKIVEHEMVFFVKDSGIGIPKEHHNLIFQRFIQLGMSNTENTRGTGLGLAIARAYTELIGGKIDFTSSSGEGSCFNVYIPIYQLNDMSNY